MAEAVRAADIGPGRYVCVRTGSPLGWVIRVCVRSPFDHTFVVTGDGSCVQATNRGVKQSPIADFAGSLAVVFAGDMDEGQAAAVVAKARSYVGDRYNWLDLVVIALRRAGVRWGWLLRFAAGRKSVICSELAVLCGLAASPPMGWECGEPSPALVRPDELARLGTAPVVW